MKSFLLKNKIAVVLVAIIAISLFLRLYHLTDWLHFQLDQSRDAFLTKEVIQEGIKELPLLGPRAGGSFLRLGPAYYYFMYLLALVANSFHPVVYALPEIIGNIAFVPLFYLLSRRLFSQKWSLILTLLAVTSTFLVVYDRFSWNPNLLPVFSVITIYTWLRFFEAKREENYRSAYKWIALAALSIGIFVQLHFVAFVAIPLILGISALFFWLRSRFFEPALSKKYLKNILKEILLFLAIFTFIQTPVILNEYLSKGTNTSQLFSTVSEKEGKDESHTFAEKMVQNLWVYPKGYFISSTGVDTIDFPVWRFNPTFNIICDDKCRKSLTPTLIGATFFFLSALAFILVFFKKTRAALKLSNLKKIKQNKLTGEWEFLMLLTLWIVIPWWAFYSLSFTLRPRFFLFSVVPFWIITGILIRELVKSRLGKICAYGLVVILFATNITNNVIRFNQLAQAEKADIGEYPQDQILFQDESYPVTLKQEQEIALWIKNQFEQQKEDKDYLFLWAPSYYYRPILYLLSNYDLGDKAAYFSNYPVWEHATYFAVSRTSRPEKFFKGARAESFEAFDYQVFGTLTVYKLKLTDKGIASAKSREKKFLAGQKLAGEERIEQKCLTKPKPSCRYTWGDLFK